MDHVIGAGVRGISKTIAITSEAIAGKRRDAQANDHSTTPTPGAADDDGNGDDNFTEREWDLDELANELEHEPSTGALGIGSGTSLELGHANPAALSAIRPIPQPVILPQRRPRDRARGFIRAYAPVLGECSGISQETFLAFLNDFEKASRASPIFTVVNAACFGIGLVPSSICMAVSTAVGVASGVAQELQIRYRNNKYLVDINETLYKPRGLFAMIMAYSPERSQDLLLQADHADPTAVALSNALEDRSKAKEVMRRLRKISSGKVTSDVQIPESAPLVYPILDRVLLAEPPSGDQSTAGSQAMTTTSNSLLKQHAANINDYLDRRAQAEFASTHLGSKLVQAMPPSQKPFVNRFCDPNHPVNSGSIFGLLSGGTFDPIAAGRVRRVERKLRRRGDPPLDAQERHDAYMGRKVRGNVTGTPSKAVPLIEKLVKKDVLYLVIVNLPTEEELEMVRSALRD